MTTGRPDDERQHRHEDRSMTADNRDMGSLVQEDER
jgi:hypothetical protein